jgi:ion channel
VHILTAVFGLALLVFVLWDGFEAMVLPRRVTRKIRVSRLFYRSTWKVWSAIGRRMDPGKRREAYLSVYGPLSMLLLFGVWAIGLVCSFGLIYWSLGSPLRADFPMNLWLDLYMSGTTFFTLGLGDIVPRSGLARLIIVAEAGMGLAFLALLLSYLPVLYQSFSRREVAIALLDARAGSPASAGELLRRHHHGGLDGAALAALLRDWERWAAELLESHVSFPVLCYFRSQHDNQSWLAALTSMLDTCAIVIHGVGGATGWQAQLTFAMARHAIVDLAQILSTPPVPPETDRLPAAEFERLQCTLEKTGLDLRQQPELLTRMAELRAMYEPFVNAMAQRLLLQLPPWTHGGRIDNWRTSAWGRIVSRTSVLPLADLGDEEHR